MKLWCYLIGTAMQRGENLDTVELEKKYQTSVTAWQNAENVHDEEAAMDAGADMLYYASCLDYVGIRSNAHVEATYNQFSGCAYSLDRILATTFLKYK